MWWNCTDKDFLNRLNNAGCTGQLLIFEIDDFYHVESGEIVQFFRNEETNKIIKLHVFATDKPRMAEWEPVADRCPQCKVPMKYEPETGWICPLVGVNHE